MSEKDTQETQENVGAALGKEIKDNTDNFKDAPPDNVIPIQRGNGDSAEKQEIPAAVSVQQPKTVRMLQLHELETGEVGFATMPGETMSVDDMLSMLSRAQLTMLKVGFSGYVADLVQNGMATASANILQEVGKIIGQATTVLVEVGEFTDGHISADALPEIEKSEMYVVDPGASAEQPEQYESTDRAESSPV